MKTKKLKKDWEIWKEWNAHKMVIVGPRLIGTISCASLLNFDVWCNLPRAFTF
jgi:hypothetical protein